MRPPTKEDLKQWAFTPIATTIKHMEVQGELLSFAKWQRVATTLGVDEIVEGSTKVFHLMKKPKTQRSFILVGVTD